MSCESLEIEIVKLNSSVEEKDKRIHELIKNMKDMEKRITDSNDNIFLKKNHNIALILSNIREEVQRKKLEISLGFNKKTGVLKSDNISLVQKYQRIWFNGTVQFIKRFPLISKPLIFVKHKIFK